MELDRYNSTISVVSFRPDPRVLCTLGRHLISLWDIPHRVYHTTEHLDNCLRELDDYSHTHMLHSSSFISIEIALWYHDAVYSPSGSNNERLSAEWATEDMITFKMPAGTISDVSRLIMATKHAVYPNQQEDEQVIVDIDLTILGKDPDTYSSYLNGIREEYSHVDNYAYKLGRSKFLQKILDRPSIYQTPFFKDKYEEPARQNLQKEIKFLSM